MSAATATHWFDRQAEWRPCPEAVTARLTRRLERCERTGCLLWTGGTDRWGYGKLEVRISAREIYTVQVHRLRYALDNGRWPQLHVLHSCDTPACAEVRHLREGTHQENMNDAVLRGRKAYSYRGGAFSPAVLDRVMSLRGQVPATELAAELAVHPSTIHRYWTGELGRSRALLSTPSRRVEA